MVLPLRSDPEALAELVHQGSRADLSRAVTLVESTRPDDRLAARTLLSSLIEPAEPSVRVGVSGVPGVGKSTLIETLGMTLIEQGHRVGVLAVDPSSQRTGGSVLGDKTRMPRLAVHPDAYVRPSPTAGTLGGVARSTAQTISLLEAGGYDTVLVETVGVGQSETTVAGMVDTFLLLALARAGDQLQGIKKGVLEIADVIAINKADGDHITEARAAARELAGALHLVHAGNSAWTAPVLTCSGLTDEGIQRVWGTVLRHRESLGPAGLARRRAEQRVTLAWGLIRDELDQRLRRSAGVSAIRDDIEAAVRGGSLGAAAAADAILAAFDR